MAITATNDPDIALWRLARAGVDDLLGLIHAGDWTRSTPCTEWNVRDVLNHLVGSNWRYVALLQGGSGREFWRVRAEEKVLGDDPVVDWRLSADALDAAFLEPGAMERPVDFGLSTGRELLRGRVFDVTIHSWDLAQALGAGLTLDERLVAACLTTPFAAILARGEGMPATEDHEQLAARPARPLPKGPSDEERLLWLCGRKTSLG
ncbi:MAG TPA: TIGR03086 family metal-binding protein [Aeromicrobium sp.]|nr:TIGR03086 family metal-binding protein [Aeromicrobium sp.]